MPSTAMLHQRSMCFCHCDVFVNTSHIINLLIDTDAIDIYLVSALV